MRLRVKLSECLLMIVPDIYIPYVAIEKGKHDIVNKKAISGTLKAALLFYKKLIKYLLEFGSKINPYDVFVLKKQVSGKQMKTVSHVDGMKVSHHDNQEIAIFIQCLKKKWKD